ncbi:MAG: hypothetical protein U5K72_15335 [Balneolaceae bacterium]|nr:hypothetical protein [Balneolaceae bacterium]
MSFKLETKDLTVKYGDVIGVKDISLAAAHRSVTALIGPSGCGNNLSEGA